MNGIVLSIFIASKAGEPMRSVQSVKAVAGRGLEGDRYYNAEGSFSLGRQGARQVTLINAIFFPGSGFQSIESRRNIVVYDVELMWLIGKEFKIGNAIFKGVKYCDPCDKPKNLYGQQKSFKKAFFDRGGLIAEIIESNVIYVNDLVVLPPKNY